MNTYHGKSTELGGGGKFSKGRDAIMQKEGYSKERASAIMAAQGRKKYGKSLFQRLAARGRKQS